MRSSVLVPLLLSGAIAAQTTIVSPVGATTVEGSSGNAFPWTTNTPRRYMQIHSDVGGTPKVITKVSFRQGAGTGNNLGTRIYDMELYMGEGRHALSPSYTFDNNYSAPKQLMLARQNITFGPQGQAASPGPSPFNGMDLLLTTPFVYTGVNSLIWEVTFYSMTIGAAGTFATPDAEQGAITASTQIITGTGCTATGQTALMTHTVQAADIAGTLALNFVVTAGPANAPCLLALGLSNPDLPVTGLCSNLLTDLFQVLFIGNTDGAGAITTNTPSASTIVLPNTIPGAILFTQVHAIDLARTDPIPVTNSNGRQITMPTSNLIRVDEATRIFNNAGGTAATQGIFFTSTIGYALVTQFTY